MTRASWTDQSAGLLERSIAYTIGNLAMIRPSMLSRATPCTGWELSALLWHLAGSLETVAELLSALRHEATQDRVGNDLDACPIAAARGAAQLVLAGLSAPTRRTVAVGARAIPVELVMLTGALEVALHGWDIGHAADSSGRLPPGLADELLAIAALLVTDQDRGSLFARRIGVPGCATSADRLVAYMGRDPYPNRNVAET
jgi:uncharacterized protein (TIGR03086 family)